jgi:hypothetical protein
VRPDARVRCATVCTGGEAVKNDQCFGIGGQAALHKVHLITSLIAADGRDRVFQEREWVGATKGGRWSATRVLCMRTAEMRRRNEAVLQISGASREDLGRAG